MRKLPSRLLTLLAPAWLSAVLAAGLMPSAAHALAEERENCFHTASVKYQLDPWLLVAIARVESRMRPDAHRKYDDGSEDIGLMQINSVWLPALARHGIARADLFNHCTSIHVAAWILATQLYRYGKTWQVVGRYHSTTPAKNAVWVALIMTRLREEHPNFAQLNEGLTMTRVSASSVAPLPRQLAAVAKPA